MKFALVTLIAVGICQPFQEPAKAVPEAHNVSSTRSPSESQIVLHQRADIALLQGRYGDAESSFLAALKVTPEDPTLMYGLACALSRAGDYDRALECLTKARTFGYRDAAVAHWDPDLFSLSYNPHFKALMGTKPVIPPDAVGWAFAGQQRVALVTAHAADWIAIAPPLGGIEVLESLSGEVRFRTPTGTVPVVALAASLTGTSLAALQADGVLNLIDTATGECKVGERATGTRQTHSTPTLAFVDNGRQVVAWTDVGVALWDAMGKFDGELVRTNDTSRLPGGTSQSSALIPEIDGKTVRLRGTSDEDTSPDELSFEHSVSMVQLSPNGEVMAVGTKPGTVHLIRVVDGSEIWSQVITDSMTGNGYGLMGDAMCVPVLRFLPNGERLVACTTTSFFVACFDVATGEQVWRTNHLGGRMGASMPLICGDDLVVGDHGRQSWDASSGAEHADWPIARGGALAVIGEEVLIANSEGIMLTDGRSGKVRWRSPSSARTNYLIEHPSGWLAGPVEQSKVLEYADRFDPKRVRAGLAGIRLLTPQH